MKMVAGTFTAIRLTLVMLVLTGVAYPLLTTAAAELLFSQRAHGSLVKDDKGQVVGSSLIGQSFTQPGYFQGRPSAAGEKGYDATASSGSNLGPTSKKLRERITADLQRLQVENPDADVTVPDALVTASASGLDPDVPLDAARWQLNRVAKARAVAPERVARILEAHEAPRELGIFGEPRVNVLELNLALDAQFGRPAPLAGK